MTSLSTAQTATVATDLRSGLPFALPHEPGALLVLGDYGCGKTFVMKKLLADSLKDGRNALLFDALGGGHAYDHLYDALLPETRYSVTPGAEGLYTTSAQDPEDLDGALADESLTHLFFDPIDHCLKIPEIVAAFGAARSRGRFAVGAAGMGVLADKALEEMLEEGRKVAVSGEAAEQEPPEQRVGPLIQAEPSLLLMYTRDQSRPKVVPKLFEEWGLSPGFLQDQRPGEALYIGPHDDPTPLRFDLAPEEIALFGGPPE